MAGTNEIGAPVPLQLGSIGTVLLSPLTIEAWETLRMAGEEKAWGKGEQRIAYLAKLGIDTPEWKKEVADWVFKQLDTGRASTEYTASPEGTAMLIWLCTRTRHPTVTLEMIKKEIQYCDLSTLQRKIDRINIPLKQPVVIGTTDGDEQLDSSRQPAD